MALHAVSLEPYLDARCAVCAGGEPEEILGPAEVQRERQRLSAFHRRRLRRDAPPSALCDRADFTQDYATSIVSCGGCGLVFRTPRPSALAITRAYRKDHYGQERLEALFASQLALYRAKARTVARILGPRPHAIVEAGSFVGGFLAAAREAGYEVLGVDPGEEVTAFCAERGLPVFHSTLEQAPLAPDSVDCVAIWNTFDQLADPEPTLRVARRALRRGGLLALRVPNGACFLAWEALRRRAPRPIALAIGAALAWNNLAAFPYLYGYSPATLDRLVLRHGFLRVQAAPDTLPRSAERYTRAWAAAEEWLGQAVLELLGRASAAAAPDRMPHAPWFDAYYRAA